MQQIVVAVPQVQSLLSRFNGVYIRDSTVVSLPDALVPVFGGHNRDGDASAKTAVQWDLQRGAIGLWFSAGIVHDPRTGPAAETLPPGSQRLLI